MPYRAREYVKKEPSKDMIKRTAQRDYFNIFCDFHNDEIRLLETNTYPLFVHSLNLY